jgi:hypothetical protein
MWKEWHFDEPRNNNDIVVYKNKYVHDYNLWFLPSEYKIQSWIVTNSICIVTTAEMIIN